MTNMSYTSILKGDPGKLFKGHTFNLTQQNYGDGTMLTLSQNYFSSQSVVSIYSVNDNKTDTLFTYYPFGMRTPIWFHKYCSEIQNLALPLTQSCKRDDFELTIMPNHAHVSFKTKCEGLNFTGHRENINKFSELKYKWAQIRDWLKHVNHAKLTSCDIEDNQLILPISI